MSFELIDDQSVGVDVMNGPNNVAVAIAEDCEDCEDATRLLLFVGVAITLRR